jgi:hypothetical protein
MRCKYREKLFIQTKHPVKNRQENKTKTEAIFQVTSVSVEN